MFAVLKRSVLIRDGLKILQNQKSAIYSKPPKETIGAVPSVFALCVFAVTLLAPAGWILHHIPEYRQRSSPQH